MSSDCFRLIRLFGLVTAIAGFLAAGLLTRPAHAFVLLPKECRERQAECMKKQSLDWILIFGEIGYEEDDFFYRLDKIWPKDKPLPVIYLESSGGNARTGMRVGWILHRRNATVATGNPITKDDGQQCSSSCALIALGAKERHLRHFGVHQPYNIENYCQGNEQIHKTSQEFLQKTIDYFYQMGAPAELIDIYKLTPHDQFAEYYHAQMINPENQGIVRWGLYYTPGPDSKVKMFPVGLGPRDLSEIDELNFAIDAGSKEAVQSLADHYLCLRHRNKPNYNKSAAVLRKAFENNDNDAGYRLASMIKSGNVDGQSKADAIGILSKLADRKYPDAQVDLGLLYYSGQHLPKNYLRAIELIKNAAKQKSPAAFSAFCKIYSEQKALKRDDIEAYKWCDLAIATLESGKDKDYATERIHALANRMSDREIDNAMKREIPWKEEADHEEED
jgi:TPR repeat protein